MAIVPSAEEMPDDIFRQHLERRHLPAGDFDSLGGFRAGRHFSANASTFRTYHRYCHSKFEYDHEHTEMDDE